MIMAEKLSVDCMRYVSMQYFDNHTVKFNHLPPTTYRDKRLNWRYLKTAAEFPIRLSMTLPLLFFVNTNIKPERYLILVPREVVNVLGSNALVLEFFRKCVFIVGLLLFAAMCTAIRYSSQHVVTDDQSRVTPTRMSLFFDNFARVLGTSCEVWMSPVTSERQLLVAVGFSGFIVSSIFSGILYESLLMEEKLQYRYNSLQDVCDAGLKINIPFDLINYFQAISDLEPWLKYMLVYVYMNECYHLILQKLQA